MIVYQKIIVYTILFCCVIGIFPHSALASQPLFKERYVLAQVNSNQGNSGNDDKGEDGNKEEKTGGSNDNKGLIDSIKSLVKSIGEFVDNVKLILQGKLFDIVLEWAGKQLDIFFRSVNGLLGTAFMYTPPMHTKPWIHKCWSFVFWISLAFLVLASVIAAGRVLKDGDTVETLKILIPAFGLAIASFYLIDFSIYIINKMSTTILQSTISLVDSFGGKVKVGDPAAGDIIVKLMFSPDAAFGTKTGDEAKLYNILTKNGGMILLIVGYPILFLVALVSLARYLLIVGLAIGSPVWHAGASLFGRWETIIGFWYQIGRLLGLELVAGIVWLLCVSLQLAEIGKLKLSISPQSTNVVVYADALGIGLSATLAVPLILMAYLTFSFIFVKNSWVATLKDPISLGGAGVMLGVSKLGGKAALIGRGLSQRFDNPVWEKRSMKLGEAAKKAGDLGKAWAERSRNQPAGKALADRLKNAAYSAEKASSPIEVSGKPYQVEKTPRIFFSAESTPDKKVFVNWTSIKVLENDRDTLINKLNKMPNKPVIEIDHRVNDCILVAPGYVNTVLKFLESHYACKTPYWSDGSNYVTVENGLPVVRPNPPADGIYMGPWRR